MRAFAEAWPDGEFVQQVLAQLPWGHNLFLFNKLKASDQRLCYAHRAAEYGWSRVEAIEQALAGDGEAALQG